MVRISRRSLSKYKIIIYAKSKYSIENILIGCKINSSEPITKDNSGYRVTIYGEIMTHNGQIIKSYYVGDDAWVFEYHHPYYFIYHNHTYEEYFLNDVSTSVDVLYRTGPSSIEDAIDILFKKKIFLEDTNELSILLEMQETNLYKSILKKITFTYLNDKYVTRLNLDQVRVVNIYIAKILGSLKEYSTFFYKLNHLSIDKFLFLVNE